MAEIRQGTIKTVTSLTAGTVEYISGGGMDTYSDATLPTRGIALSPGDLVIGYQNPTLSNIVLLQPIYDKILADLLANNSLTSDGIKNSLLFYNCCAQKKGQEYIDALTKGSKCSEILADATLMRNMVNGLFGFIPSGEIIGGRQATHEIIVTGVGNPLLTMDVTVSIGSVDYVISIPTSPVRTTANAAVFIADFINALYPQSYSYFATVSGDNIVLSGSNFDADNGTSVILAISNGVIINAPFQALAGGTAEVLQANSNCITNEQAQSILDKLNKLCSKPCNEVTNFAS